MPRGKQRQRYPHAENDTLDVDAESLVEMLLGHSVPCQGCRSVDFRHALNAPPIRTSGDPTAPGICGVGLAFSAKDIVLGGNDQRRRTAALIAV